MIQNILSIAGVAVMIWLAVECFHVHKINKRVDKLIEAMEKEMGGSGEDADKERTD